MPYEDLLDSSELLIQAITLRWEYCKPAFHSFPSTTARYLHIDEHRLPYSETIHGDKKTVEGTLLNGLNYYTRILCSSCDILLRSLRVEQLTVCYVRKLLI